MGTEKQEGEREMKYYITSEIHLSLEDYHNAGLSPDETKETIEGIVNPFQANGFYSSCDRLRCHPSGINHNLVVRTLQTDPLRISHIVDIIRYELDQKLNEKLNNIIGLGDEKK